MIWLVMTIAALASLAWIILPLFRADRDLTARADGELAVYRNQLTELEGDVERGLITKDQASAEEIEISRRMLAVTKPGRDRQTSGLGKSARNATIGIIAAIAVLGPMIVYSRTGSPQLGAHPQIKRESAASDHSTNDMSSAIDRLVDRLAKNPDDFDGWVLLARSYQFAKDLDNAAEAWGHAFELRREDVGIAGSYAEALTMAAGGIIPPAAKLIFEQLRQENPEDPRNHYYVGIAETQAGRGQAALDIWLALLARSPADASWVPAVRQQIDQTARQFGIKVGEITFLPPAGPVPVTAQRADVPGPTAQDMAAASKMTSDEQTAMIRSMVERLAERLEENPDDVEGWLRLARAQAVLEGPASAKPSLERALGASTSESSRQTILAAANEFGITLEGS